MVLSVGGRTLVGVRRVDMGLVGVAVVWGSSYLVARSVAVAADPGVVLFWRYVLSALACLLLVSRVRPIVTAAELRSGGLLGLSQAAVLALETYGVAHTSAANAGVLISLAIVLTPLLDTGAAAGRSGLLAAAGVCVLGVVLLVGADGLTRIHSGDLLVLGAAVVRAAHVVWIGRLGRRTPLRPLPLTSVQMVVGSVVFAPLALLHRTPAVSDGSWWAGVGYLALGCSVFAFLTQTWAVRSTSASRAGLLLGTEPVWAVLVAVVFGGETLGPAAVVGSVLVVGGCFWGRRLEQRIRTDAGPMARGPGGQASMSSGWSSGSVP